MTDFTIVIPHRGNTLGLWATVHSCEEELRGSNHNYNFVVVSNGEALGSDAVNVIKHLDIGGRLLRHVHSDEALTPPVARQRGADVADGRLLFFFDNHCLVGKQYFDRAVYDFDKYRDMDMLHSSTVFYTADGTHYHYKLKLDYNFWASSSMSPPYDYKPYKIAAGGHGGIVVRKSVWDDVGGYGPDSLFSGYGGEELIFDLKLWRYGYQVYIDPKLIHYHYTGVRGYDRHWTDDYYVNLMVSAHVAGGEQWLRRVYESFENRKHIRLRPKKSMYDLLQVAYERSAEYAHEVESRSLRTLDDQLLWFRENVVEM